MKKGQSSPKKVSKSVILVFECSYLGHVVFDSLLVIGIGERTRGVAGGVIVQCWIEVSL